MNVFKGVRAITYTLYKKTLTRMQPFFVSILNEKDRKTPTNAVFT